MMRSTLIRIVLAAGLTAGGAALARAQESTAPRPPQRDGVQERQDGPGAGRLRRGPRGLRRGLRRGMRARLTGLRALGRLDLTDAQREQMRGLRQKYREANRARGTELRELMRQRREGGELSADQQARAKALIEELRASRESMRQESLGALTPEQRTRLEQMRAEMGQRREEMRRWRQEMRQHREEFRQRRLQQQQQ